MEHDSCNKIDLAYCTCRQRTLHQSKWFQCANRSTKYHEVTPFEPGDGHLPHYLKIILMSFL